MTQAAMPSPDPDRDPAETRPHHDMGGLPGGPIDRSEHALAPWEKQVDAIRVLLGARGLLPPDELRLGIERLPPSEYDRSSYYERWTASILALVIAKGLVEPDAFTTRVAAILAQRRERT